MNRLLLVGATGGVGSAILRQILAPPNSYPPGLIRVSTRDPAKAAFPSGVEVVQGDLEDPSSYSRLFAGIDRVFLYAKSRAPLDQLFTAIKDSGAKHIVLLSSMWVVSDPDGLLGSMHMKVEESVRRAGLSYTFLRPGNFASNSRSNWMSQVESTGKLILTYPGAQSAPVSDDDIAAVGIVGLTSNKLLNQAVSLTGPVSLSQIEQVEAINRLRERAQKSPLKLVVVSPSEWKAQFSGIIPAAFIDQTLSWMKSVDGKPERIQASARITGLPSQSFEQWLELHKDEYLKWGSTIDGRTKFSDHFNL